MVKTIIKRNGEVVPFEQGKITEAIWKAVKSVGGKDREKTEHISGLVVKVLEEKFTGVIPSVEQVQDVVESVLIKEGHDDTSIAYINYRKSREGVRDTKAIFDTITAVDDYLGDNDWEIRENSNMDYSLQGLNNFLNQKLISNYWLGRVYSKKVGKEHKDADIHVHDLGCLGPYCVGWDLEDLLRVGLKGVRGKTESKPAKHLDTVLGQMVNFFYTLQGESAGAQAFSNFDTLLAPFVRYDNLTEKKVEQEMQKFLFNINVPTRVGFQTPFTNITMDLKVPKHMKDQPVVVGGEIKPETYGDFQKEVDMINSAFAKCMLEGDATGKLFSFPIPTYNITKDFDWDNPNHTVIWEMTAKYGIPYFSNFVNSDMDPEDARSMCCRLKLDNRVLRKRGGGLFGSNPLTGSIGVVTINMPRLGFVSSTEEGFFGRLEELMEVSKESLETKRKFIEANTENKNCLYPYSKFYLRNVKERFGKYWENHFSTIGLLGMNEGVKNFMHGEDITTEKGREFSLKVLNFMRDKLEEFQESTGHMYNLEATPGEGTTYRFAKVDRKKLKGIIVANEEAVKKGAEPYYTNSTQLPVDYTDDLFGALEMQEEFQTLYTGGTSMHLYLGESPSPKNVKRMIDKITRKFRHPYITFTPTFSICSSDGYLEGNQESCPKCGEECDVYSRTVGYIRPRRQMNAGKQEEFDDRKMFKIQ